MSREPLDFVFRPLLQWPGPLKASRKRAIFRTPYNATIRLLDEELRHLHAKNVVLQIALSEADIRRDGRPRSYSRPSHPGVIVAFNSVHGPLSYPCDTFDSWEDNLRAIALALKHLRTVDRYGVTKRGEQYRGWSALPPPSNGMSQANAKAFLDSLGGERQALFASHPDRGGSKETFAKVQEARKVLGLT